MSDSDSPIDLREAYQRHVAARNWHLVRCVPIAGAAVVCLSVGGMIKDQRGWFVLAGLLFLVALIWYLAFVKVLRCPACDENLGPELERYCPQCGDDGSLEDRDWRGLGGAKCERCGTKSYHLSRPLRFCTHCGIQLVE